MGGIGLGEITGAEGIRGEWDKGRGGLVVRACNKNTWFAQVSKRVFSKILAPCVQWNPNMRPWLWTQTWATTKAVTGLHPMKHKGKISFVPPTQSI